MKKTIMTLFLLGLVNLSFSQNSFIEKSVTGIQIGFFGTEIYNETRLSDKIALRSQFGLNAGIFGGSLYEKTGFILYPELSIEPKWYYNLDKRISKNKNIKNNGANFYSLNIQYFPNWFEISNYENLEVYNTLSVIPTWGFRRNFAEKFNYEFRIGLGYGVSYRDSEYLKNEKGAIMDLGFKIGYDF
jgi:hypothetical protein